MLKTKIINKWSKTSKEKLLYFPPASMSIEKEGIKKYKNSVGYLKRKKKN